MSSVLQASNYYPSKTAAIKLMDPPKMPNKYEHFFDLLATTTSSSSSHYSSWCEVCLDIKSSHSIQYPQKCIVRSTYRSLPRPFQTLYSVHRCFRWCLWSSVVSGTWFSRTTSCIPFTHIYTHPTEMEYNRAGSLWHLLCCDRVELLSTRIWHCCLQWP